MIIPKKMMAVCYRQRFDQIDPSFSLDEFHENSDHERDLHTDDDFY
jgi:hypothetical protein